MPVDFEKLARQYSGRKLAELILEHAKQKPQQNQAALLGLVKEIGSELNEPVMELIDFLNSSSHEEKKEFFSADLGKQFLSLIDMIKGFLGLQYQLRITQDEAFSIFNILILNWALACQTSAETKAAMQKATGAGFIGRLFGR